MKATGIVRRIDDLGRVVIPKEIRRTMRIREGDPLEIFTDRDGEVIFKKYSPIGELSELAVTYCDVLVKSTEQSVIICDRDHCIAAAGIPKKEVLDRRVTTALEDIMESRRIYTSLKCEIQIIAMTGSNFNIRNLYRCLCLPINRQVIQCQDTVCSCRINE